MSRIYSGSIPALHITPWPFVVVAILGPAMALIGVYVPAHIAGRCTVFAESEMIHEQQTGTPLEDIAYGLCKTLVHNYLSSTAAGKEFLSPVVFQGGVARNPGMVRAFEEELGLKLVIPPNPELTGATGAALLGQKGVAEISDRLSAVSDQ